MSPVLDLSIELSSSSTSEAKAPGPIDPSSSEKVEPPEEAAPKPDTHLNLRIQHPQESEPSVQHKTHDVEQDDPGDSALIGADDQHELLE